MTTPAFLDVSRRQFFRQSGLGLGSVALGSMLARDLPAAAAIAGPRPHFAPKAKHIIYLHMIGAPSQLDLYDYKPLLQKMDGQTCPEELTKGKRFAFIGGEMKLAGTEFKFQRHGQSGLELSELLPHLGTVADDICVVKSLHTNEINHAPAQMFLHTGFGQGGRPSMGAWVTYGLGTENRDLPAYVVLLSGPAGGAGSTLWSTGFLPSVYQGIQFRGSGEPVLFLGNPPGHSSKDRRHVLDAVKALNEQQLGVVGDPEIATRISQYEMAYRMQTSVPELMDIAHENKATLDMYGAQPGKASFANNCLLARRLIERGVRMVQLFDSDWDHHGGLKQRLTAKAKDVDQPMAALVRDLKQRGLLDETLVIWGGEFGRTPLRQGANGDGTKTSPGRDHHKDAYTMWMAGGGTRPGTVYGKTDDFGFNIAENGVHTHDLNATVLNLLGLDHERLTFRYQGRDFRLTDVHGELVPGIMA
ncbi:DUF1501 domain-containing protein [Prosthecobacter sp.]|uniref:DUF1501 domain-containing protein n=1 Tax=Prosthecobacter sp. TaxID=1965333 RepID=UPI0037847A49